MLLKTKKGNFRLLRNYRDAFNLEKFEECYVEECYDKYPYIVGDISAEILRLKGFDNNKDSKQYFQDIDKYLDTSCAYGCAFYVLKRLNTEQEVKEAIEAGNDIPDETIKIRTLEKENFDKDSLVLISTPKENVNIVIDVQKINSMPQGHLPKDLEDIAKEESLADKGREKRDKKKTEKVEVEVTPSNTYVSSSPDFDPSKKKDSRFNKNFNKNKNNHQNNKKNKGENNHQ